MPSSPVAPEPQPGATTPTASRGQVSLTRVATQELVNLSRILRTGEYPTEGVFSRFNRNEASTVASAHFEEEEVVDHTLSWMVMKERNRYRIAWTILISSLLVYTGTIFLYRLCFFDFRIPENCDNPDDGAKTEEPTPGWDSFDMFINVTFWIDLVANFFFSYEDDAEREVDSMKLIAKKYLRTYFGINLAACIPEEVVKDLMIAIMAKADGGTSSKKDSTKGTQSLRVLRLQRMSRLARLVRIIRLGKLSASFNSKAWRNFRQMKGVQVINLAIGLTWCVHIFACGWYLVASLHSECMETWVARRQVDHTGNLLKDSPQFTIWMHCMYFIFTVFTTVGFGDISGFTVGECTYVFLTMIVGAVVHSILLSEVINVLNSNDQTNEFVVKQKALINAFADHTMLGDVARRDLVCWIAEAAKIMASAGYDRREMRNLIEGKFMPRELMVRLPLELFGGKLLNNSFLKVCHKIPSVPPRLPLLLALALQKTYWAAGEVVFEVADYAFNLYLVVDGTFAYVAKPSIHGGIPLPRAASGSSLSEDNGKMGSYQSMNINGRLDRKLAFSTMNALYPFQLFGFYSYFGECELVLNFPRRATMRCESEPGEGSSHGFGGTLLMLHKNDFRALSEEFPQFGARWKTSAPERDAVRKRFMVNLKTGLDYRNMAASIIQREVRRRIGGQFQQEVRESLGGKLAEASAVMRSSGFGLDKGKKRPEEELREAVTSLQQDIELLTNELDSLRLSGSWF